MADLIPEPPDRTIALVGAEGYERVFMRDDSGVADTDLDHWWAMPSKVGDDPLPWQDVRARGNVRLYYPQAAVDQAVRDAGLTVIGEHIIERGGYCRTCGSRHSPEEIARLEDRLTEEDAVVRRIGEEARPC